MKIFHLVLSVLHHLVKFKFRITIPSSAASCANVNYYDFCGIHYLNATKYCKVSRKLD